MKLLHQNRGGTSRKKPRGIRQALWLSMLGCSQVFAHDPGLSALALRQEPAGLSVTLTLAKLDAECLVAPLAGDEGAKGREKFSEIEVKLQETVVKGIVLCLGEKQLRPEQTVVRLDASDAVHVTVRFPAVAGHQLQVRSALLEQLPHGHRQYATVLDSAGRVSASRMLDSTHPLLETTLSETNAAPPTSATARPAAWQFLWLGLEHIATGYDHLVFLFGLLIVGGRFQGVLKVITSFTVAHSLTLALAALSIVRLPSSVVEPLIAGSIVYVGVENLFRRDLERRWLLTFGFGLVHGCGFATVLRDLGLGAGGSAVALPLFAFNLGVELGQVALAAVVLPLVWRLRRYSWFEPRSVPACSLLVAAAGGYWLVSRVWPSLGLA